MTRINTNIEALRGLRNVQKSNNLLNTSLARLSTGLKINTGKDNPSGLIAGETLRLQQTTLEQSIKNSNRANNVISTADSALGEISGLLNQVRGLVQEGLNVGALSQEETEANQLQIDQALSAINRISANTSFAGDKLIDGSKAFSTTVSTADLAKLTDYKVNEAVFGTRSSIDVNATVNSVASKAQLRYTAGDLSSATTIELGGTNGNQTLFLGGSSTVANIRDAINDVTDSTGISARILASATQSIAAIPATATLNPAGANNSLVFTDARAAGTAGTLSVVFADPGSNNAALGVNVSAPDGNGNQTITVNLATDGSGAITTTADDIKTAIAGNVTAAALVTVADDGLDDGTGVVTAIASTNLTGGVGAGSLSFTDQRIGGSAGTLSVAVDGTGNNQTLGVSIGAPDGNGNRTISITLATDGSGNVTSTLQDVADLIADDEDAAALLKVSVNGNGGALGDDLAATQLTEASGTVLALESRGYGSDQFVNLNVLNGSFLTYGEDQTTYTTRDSGTDIAVTINGQAALGKGLQASIKTGTLDAQLNFKETSNTVNATAKVSITGGGALFQIGQEANTAGQIGLGIEAINTARLGGITGKLYELGTGGGKSLLDVRSSLLGTGEKVAQSDLVNIIDEALNRVSSLRGRLGSIQKNVIDTNISTLGVALENITESRSQIVDTDFAEETAALQKAQILSQAGISVLSIANQSPQSVLSLLR